MNIKKIWTKDEAVSPVIAVILMVAITVVLAAVLYVWASGLASTGGSAPPAFSASVADTGDTPSTYVSAVSPWKNFASQTGATSSASLVTLSARPMDTTYAFMLRYVNTTVTGPQGHYDLYINMTFKDETGTSRTVTNLVFAETDGDCKLVTFAALGFPNARGVSQVTALAVTNCTAANTALSTTETVYVSTTAYDTIVSVTASQGRPGDITKLSFYIKVGATGTWTKLTPESTYAVGSIVLDNSDDDKSWDTGEIVYISETSANTDLISSSSTSQQVFVRIIHDPSTSTIYESASATNVL